MQAICKCFGGGVAPTYATPTLVALLDDLDKELNNYSMRLREWYGWHFPELGKIVVDNLLYARTVKTIGKQGLLV